MKVTNKEEDDDDDEEERIKTWSNQ
jgi:hypothetical protein